MTPNPASASPAPKQKTIGIIGAGQLGRMLALAGYPLGLRFVFLDKRADAPGAQVGGIILGELNDAQKIAELAAQVDVLTYDVENVPVAALGDIPKHKTFFPPVAALAAGQDRLSEKQLFQKLKIPTAKYRTVDSMPDLEQAIQAIGYPAVLKTRQLGYDGRGQRLIRSPAELGSAFNALGGVPLLLEQFIEFEREVSLIAVRNPRGDMRFYPLSENRHSDGILRLSLAPYADRKLQARAQLYLKRILQHFDYAGVLTVEFFVKNGQLIANETAPRVHNSGHWTIEGVVTSQFENHIRAILDLPLGDTSTIGHSAMVNFIGQMPAVADVLEIPGAHYHDYGKQPRPGRKLGHATLVCKTRKELMSRLQNFPGLDA
ncbi:MAG: 5-(carboxyamino)imidazole ribonucleotide synthase [Gammaproteobacteria bacterium]|nr:5-(carboxyamino)imidazole ribonucleotide synthase [Gammaproteobacteria bacterium]MBU6509155.1 5-(carboxyamino)imidazole ribonucleotide synthase [Gammaproteobacteria bacterium]MDE1983175.1 5-(carboxyamino)imidazole ribonucleotide synthase [Gammaproteobacteria bacterium]MDE2108496.1 5-(carboxyamino)imidazole ribonucleotide synthase [Gammaproteobacteria bacterium]MDE2460641.1 5-(carboxyamino)imidazole ribonucleotide synthase [Gammaproteobacteria bacterium]